MKPKSVCNFRIKIFLKQVIKFFIIRILLPIVGGVIGGGLCFHFSVSKIITKINKIETQITKKIEVKVGDGQTINWNQFYFSDSDISKTLEEKILRQIIEEVAKGISKK